MKTLVQVLLLIWFVALSVFVFIPSFVVLRDARNAVNAEESLPTLPPAPVALVLSSVDPKLDPKKQEAIVKVYTQQVAAYTQQVVVYTQQTTSYRDRLTVYKANLDAAARANEVQPYTLVVKDVIVPLATTFATALLGYVFVKAGAQLIDNRIRASSNQALRPLDL